MITAKTYELFLECFDYKFPNEQDVIDRFESKKLEELIKEISAVRCSKTKQLILVQQTVEDIKGCLNIIERLKKCLVIPTTENPAPKIEFNQTHKLDDLINMRKIKAILDEKAGFKDENGKSMYFQMPLTSVFYIYFKTIAAT